MTAMVTSFFSSRGRFCNNRLGNHRYLNVIHEVEIDFYFLYPLANGFVLHIHILLGQSDKGIYICTYAFLCFQPFFRHLRCIPLFPILAQPPVFVQNRKCRCSLSRSCSDTKLHLNFLPQGMLSALTKGR